MSRSEDNRASFTLAGRVLPVSPFRQRNVAFRRMRSFDSSTSCSQPEQRELLCRHLIAGHIEYKGLASQNPLGQTIENIRIVKTASAVAIVTAEDDDFNAIASTDVAGA